MGTGGLISPPFIINKNINNRGILMKSFKQLRESTRKNTQSNAYKTGKKVGSAIATGLGKAIGGTAKLGVKTAVVPVKLSSKLAKKVVKTGVKTITGMNRQLKKQGQRAVHTQKHASYIQGVRQRQNIRHLRSIRKRQK